MNLQNIRKKEMKMELLAKVHSFILNTAIFKRNEKNESCDSVCDSREHSDFILNAESRRAKRIKNSVVSFALFSSCLDLINAK